MNTRGFNISKKLLPTYGHDVLISEYIWYMFMYFGATDIYIHVLTFLLVDLVLICCTLVYLR